MLYKRENLITLRILNKFNLSITITKFKFVQSIIFNLNYSMKTVSNKIFYSIEEHQRRLSRFEYFNGLYEIESDVKRADKHLTYF